MGSESESDVVHQEPDTSEDQPYGYVDVFSTATGDLLPLFTYEVRQELVTIGREHNSDIRFNVLQISRDQGTFTVHPPTEGEARKVLFRNTTEKEGTFFGMRKMLLNQEYEITEDSNSITMLVFQLVWRQYNPENPSGKLDKTTPMMTLSPLPRNYEENPYLTSTNVMYGKFNNAETLKWKPKPKPKSKSVVGGDVLRRVALSNIRKMAAAAAKEQTNGSKQLSKRGFAKKVEEPRMNLSEIAPKASPAQKRSGSRVEKKAEVLPVGIGEHNYSKKAEPIIFGVLVIEPEELEPPMSEVPAIEISGVEPPMISEVPPMETEEVESPFVPQILPMESAEVEPSMISVLPPIKIGAMEPPMMSEVQPVKIERLEPPMTEVLAMEVEELEPPISEVVAMKIEGLEPPKMCEVPPMETKEVEPPMMSELEALEIEAVEPPIVPPDETEEEINVSRRSKRGPPKEVEPPRISEPPKASGARKRTHAKLAKPTSFSDIKVVEVEEVNEPNTKKSRKRDAAKKNVESPKLAAAQTPPKASGVRMPTNNDTKKSKKRGASKKIVESPKLAVAEEAPFKATRDQKRTRFTLKEVADASTSAAALIEEETDDATKSKKRGAPKKNVESPKLVVGEVSAKEAPTAQKRNRSIFKETAQSSSSRAVDEERDGCKNSKKPRGEQNRDVSPIIVPQSRALRSAIRKP